MKWALWLLCVLLVSACAQSQRSTVSPTEVRPTLGSSTIAPTEPSPTEPVPTPVEPAATRPPAAPESTPQAARPAFTLAVEPVASGFERPTYVTHAGDDGLFVVEQAGSIRIVEDGAVLDIPFLSIASKVNSQAYERGLLSVAFDPDYASNGFFYVNYTRQPDGATVIERYQVSDNPGAADPDSGAVLLIIDQPEANHNGGQLQFGPDGYLYIGMGDGGGAGDRHGTIGNGQDLDALLGKMLRIDVDGGEPYAIPASNPFVDSTDARPEIWAFGIRNPWRFSFDRATGDLYIADAA